MIKKTISEEDRLFLDFAKTWIDQLLLCKRPGIATGQSSVA